MYGVNSGYNYPMYGSNNQGYMQTIDNRLSYLENQMNRGNAAQTNQGMNQGVNQGINQGMGGFMQDMIAGHNVNSAEEVENAIISLDGSIYVYPDIQHGKVYTKQLNMNDGKAVIRTYKLSTDNTGDKDRDELLAMIADIEKRLNEHIKGEV